MKLHEGNPESGVLTKTEIRGQIQVKELMVTMDLKQNKTTTKNTQKERRQFFTEEAMGVDSAI